jgi:hypothetical protein
MTHAVVIKLSMLLYTYLHKLISMMASYTKNLAILSQQITCRLNTFSFNLCKTDLTLCNSAIALHHSLAHHVTLEAWPMK